MVECEVPVASQEDHTEHDEQHEHQQNWDLVMTDVMMLVTMPMVTMTIVMMTEVHLPEERHGPQEPGEHVAHLRAEAGGRGEEMP